MYRWLERLRRLLPGPKQSYFHRDRSIELVIGEEGLDERELRAEVLVIMRERGRIDAVEYLRHRFHVPLSPAWRYVDKLDREPSG